MKLKTTQPAFGENSDAPFANDLLHREQEILDLTPMIENVPSPTVMALDAPWGAGKTVFIKMWATYLNKKRMPALYFNAWETDFAADPLVPFVEKITEQLPEENQGNLMDSAKALMPMFLGDVVRKFVGDGLAEVTEQAAENLFTHHSKLAEFKNALGEFAEAQTNKHIVIFVDELDRCRPDYAVKVLERIKHLFEVPGVVFVLATNREQLCHSIQGLYGANFDADTYLRRFIEFDFTIKPPDTKAFIDARLSALGVDKFLEDRKKHRGCKYDLDKLRGALTLLAKIYNYSLRDLEQLIARVVLVLYTLEGNMFYPILLAFLLVARQKMPEHYRKYIRPDDNGEEMREQWENDLGMADIHEGYENYSFFAVSITAQIMLTKWITQKKLEDAKSDFNTYCEEKEENATTREGELYIDDLKHAGAEFFISDIYRSRSEKILPYLVKKIEIQDKFHFPAS